MRLLIIPADPLSSYVSKGEIKKLYFNPGNIFTKIIFLNFDKVVVEPRQIKHSTGNAEVKIISLRPLSNFEQVFPWVRFLRIRKFIKTLEVDVVRGYSPFFSGYLSLKAANLLKVKNLVSIHSNFSELLKFYWDDKFYLRFIKYYILSLHVEPIVLSKSNLVQPAYEYAAQYCREKGVCCSALKTVYNRVYSSDFFPLDDKCLQLTSNKLKIICVGNLDKRKGQRVLLEALSDAKFNFSLTILGQGADDAAIRNLVDDFQMGGKVQFISAMPNKTLRKLYTEHDVFALPIKYGGICIPAIEAAACGLAVVYPKFPLASKPEVTDRFFMSVENTPKGFLEALTSLASDPMKLKELRRSSIFGYRKISCEKMEEQEVENYRSLIG